MEENQSPLNTNAPYLLEQAMRFTLPGTSKRPWVIQGHSKAGERTGFWLEPLNIVLDAGVVTNKTPNAIFISHSHVDHSWNLPWIFGCRTPKIKGYEHLSGRHVIAPQSAWPMLKQLEQACHNLSVGHMEYEGNGDQIYVEQCVSPLIVSAGMVLNDIPGLKDIQVEILPCYHPAESVGFGFSTVTQKLKPEYQTLPPKEIAQLRKNGENLTSSVIVPQLIFFGDTNIDALEKHDTWKKYPVIIIECTIYPSNKKKPTEVHEIGHIHWDSIWPIIKKNPRIFFVLIHSSLGIGRQELEDFEKKSKESGEGVNFKIWAE